MLQTQNRDGLGRFVRGNRTGITNSDRARELQLLSAQQRAKNRKRKLKRHLILEGAKIEGIDQNTLILAMLIFNAVEGNIPAIREVAKALNLFECENCYLTRWNPWREKRYQRIGQAARLVGLTDEFELIEKIAYTLTKAALDTNTRMGVNSVRSYKLVMQLLGILPCPRCKKRG